MSSPERMLARAVRMVPPRDRDRYQAEWEHDLANASSIGLSDSDVASGALRVARRLRARRLAQIMTGGYGAVAAVIAWAVV